MTERFVFTIWCDDIRQEVGNKPSFMGVYTGSIVLPQLPAVLPRLCIWTVVSSPSETPIQQLSIKVVRSDGLVLIEGDQVQAPEPSTVPEHATRQMLFFGMSVHSPLEIPEGCKFLQVIVTTGGEVLEGPKLRIEVNAELLKSFGFMEE